MTSNQAVQTEMDDHRVSKLPCLTQNAEIWALKSLKFYYHTLGIINANEHENSHELLKSCSVITDRQDSIHFMFVENF